jgi:hypothetical protein
MLEFVNPVIRFEPVLEFLNQPLEFRQALL